MPTTFPFPTPAADDAETGGISVDPTELTYLPNTVVRSLTTLPVQW